MINDVFFYKMPVLDALQGTTGGKYSKDFIYIKVSNITAISVSEDNANWSRVETTVVGPPPNYTYLTFIVPIQIDDLIKDIYDKYKVFK